MKVLLLFFFFSNKSFFSINKFLTVNFISENLSTINKWSETFLIRKDLGKDAMRRNLPKCSEVYSASRKYLSLNIEQIFASPRLCCYRIEPHVNRDEI